MRRGELGRHRPYPYVEYTTTAVLLANAMTVRALIALVSKFVDRGSDAPNKTAPRTKLSGPSQFVDTPQPPKL